MIVRPVRTRVFKENDDLAVFVLSYIKKPKEGSVVVLASKVVALAQGRTSASLGEKEMTSLVKAESEFAIKTRLGWLTIKDDVVMWNAGVDGSNAAGRLVLHPRDVFETADVLRNVLRKKWGLRKLGIIISDSRLFPLRAGVSAMALGYAGFKGVRDYRGKKDIFGRKFEYARTNVADSLASAAALEMGEGKELQPLALITDAYVEFTNRVSKNEVKIPLEDDVFRPLFAKISRKK